MSEQFIDEEHQAWLAREHDDDDAECDECGHWFDRCEMHALGGDLVCGLCAKQLCPDEFGGYEEDER